MTATGIAAWAGFGLSAASLSWQVSSWLWSGARVRVSASRDIYAERPGMIISVVNTGRLATSVNYIGLEYPHGESRLAYTPEPDLPSLPHRLEPGGEFVAWFSLQQFSEFGKRYGCHPRYLIPVARIGRRKVSGRQIGSDWPIGRPQQRKRR
jgi:hypothetical protein